MGGKNKSKKQIDSRIKKNIDVWIYFFAITTPLFELSQAIRIYSEKSSADVSLITWIYFLIDNIVWLLYGYYYKQKPILVMYALYTISEVIVIAMILFYR